MNIIVLAAIAAQGGSGSSMSFLFMMIAIFAIMWFFMIRPQQKKQKEIRKFQNELQEGTKVITAGGVYGVVKRIDLTTNIVEIEIAKGVVVSVDKTNVLADISALQAKQPKA